MSSPTFPFGDSVESGTTPPPKLSKEEQGELIKRAVELAPKYRTELLLA